MRLRETKFERELYLCFQQPQQEEVKVEETKQESSGDSPVEVAEVTTPTEATPASPNTATSPDTKETKKKDKVRRFASAFTEPGSINVLDDKINKFSSHRNIFVCQSVARLNLEGLLPRRAITRDEFADRYQMMFPHFLEEKVVLQVDQLQQEGQD